MNLDAVKVVNSKDSAALVCVFYKSKPFGFSRFLVSHQLNFLDLAVPMIWINRRF